MANRSGSRIAGWILSILIALFLMGPSAGGKLIEWEGKDKMFEHLGWTIDRMNYVAFVEIAVALLLVIPVRSVALLGTILVTAYLGGAVCTHVRVGDPWFIPVIMGVVTWLGYGLRWPAFFGHAIGRDDQAIPRS